MKTVMIPIEMIAFHNKEGIPQPMRFKYSIEDDSMTINIKKSILLEEKRDVSKNRLLVYKVKSVLRNTEKVFEVMFDSSNLKWYLYRV